MTEQGDRRVEGPLGARRTAEPEQLALLTPATGARSAARTARRAGTRAAGTVLAETDPVAQVIVDTGLAHLDRPFDYAVPADLAEAAVPGVRVKVRFAGRDLDGFVVRRVTEAAHTGRLKPLRRVVSREPVLTPAVRALAERLARSGAGTVGDVLRLAVPPRHAAAEKALSASGTACPRPEPPAGDGVASAWSPYPAAAAFLGHIASGGAPGASWLALPSVTDPALDWPSALAEAALVAVHAGRGAILVVPDHRDLARLDAAVRRVVGASAYVRLTADQGPQARYTAWLKALRGHVRVVIGTRSAAYAPVRDLGLVAWWDDGDDLHDEPRAPYVPVRDVLLARAGLEGAAALSGGFARSVAVQQAVTDRVLLPLEAPRVAVRRSAPRIRVSGEDNELVRDPAATSARLPSVAWGAAKEALAQGPVLVQVPRGGYVPAMACQDCRRAARCTACHGPVAVVAGSTTPQCRWCGRPVLEFACPSCGGARLRATVTGSRRTAEELGRAFRGVPLHTSSAGQALQSVASAPSLVVATPGAEPVAEGGYAAALLLDAWVALDRPTLDAGEEALRRWLGAAALVRSAEVGGRVVLVGAPGHTTVPAVEALVRWDPAWFADRELAERRPLGLPPAVRAAVVTGDRAAVTALLADADLPAGARTLGPAQDLLPREVMMTRPHPPGPAGQPDEPVTRAVLLVPRAEGPALAEALREAKALRSARKDAGRLTVRLDPRDPGS